ncbi:MAG TPA: PQQ-binding-like beta-propeller repeat protein, partial [Pirellulales bacterium]|nr:PQQ-binding-like beta-propeller repeat protein [Pirellulales bacterium]
MRIRRALSLACLTVVATLIAAALVAHQRLTVSEIRSTAVDRSELLPPEQPSPGDWPWWRGRNQDSIVPGGPQAIEWSVAANVRWKAPIPGRGHATPCTWGDRVFVPTADEDAQTERLLCFDLRSGAERWSIELSAGGFGLKHPKNSYASSSPACDGAHVYHSFAAHGELWVAAVTLDGRLAWKHSAGNFPANLEHGYAASLLLFEGTVIVAGDCYRGFSRLRLFAAPFRNTGFLTALDRRTGAVVWRVHRDNPANNYASPIVARLADRWQLLLPGPARIVAYDPQTGDELWWCRWKPERAANSVAVLGDEVIASGMYPNQEIVCVRADGRGDVSETHVRWRSTKNACDVPSPLVYDGRLYLLGDDGVLTCVNPDDGRVAWRQRLGGNFTAGPIV